MADENPFDFLRAMKGKSFGDMFQWGTGQDYGAKWGLRRVMPGGSLNEMQQGLNVTYDPNYAKMLWQKEQPGWMDFLAGAGEKLAQEWTESSQAQWERLNAINNQFKAMLGTGKEQIEQAGAGAKKEMAGVAEKLREKGEGGDEDVQAWLKKGEAHMAGSTEELEASRARAKEESAQFASAQAAAMERSYKETKNLIRGGVNPDGSKMTTDQQRMALEQMNQDLAMRRQEVSTQYYADERTRLENMDKAVAMAKAAEGGFAGQAAQTTVAQNQIDQGYQMLATEVEAKGIEMWNQAQVAAVQFEAGGQQALADMVRANPEGVFNYFTLMAELFNVSASLPGMPIPTTFFG